MHSLFILKINSFERQSVSFDHRDWEVGGDRDRDRASVKSVIGSCIFSSSTLLPSS